MDCMKRRFRGRNFVPWVSLAFDPLLQNRTKNWPLMGEVRRNHRNRRYYRYQQATVASHLVPIPRWSRLVSKAGDRHPKCHCTCGSLPFEAIQQVFLDIAALNTKSKRKIIREYS